MRLNSECIVWPQPRPQPQFCLQREVKIHTNLPAYLYGDWNTAPGAAASLGVSCTGPHPPAGCTFPLTMIASDRTTFLSRAGSTCSFGFQSTAGFHDSCYRWSDFAVARAASDTFYIGAFMSAASPSVPQENIERTFRVIETWGSTPSGRPTLGVRGAAFSSGRSIYAPEPQTTSTPDPQLDWGYFTPLSGFQQPPGTPRFVVGVTTRWRDLR